MHAFGPYGDRADVDFEPLAEVGLFVVSGPTGSGKSTIFDAICFALYGSLSGSRANHSDVRSHYADPHAKCTVVLVFDAEGQRWKVTRQPSQTVQKRRGVGNTVQPATAALARWNGTDWEPDTTKVRDVTARCRELVGLSLEQFERVVLLPQGKFAEVLNAKTSERSELLRTLFGSEIFDRAADILADQAREGERALQGVNEQRAVFHQRAVEAIERIEGALLELPADAGVVLETAQVAPSETQLSLLDDPGEADPAPAPADEPGTELNALVVGPVARLTVVVERRRSDAESARTARDRAEAQLRAIDQRIETLRLLAVLEAQADDMAGLTDRTVTARALLGLEAARTDRRGLRDHLDRARAAMAELWQQSLGLLPRALPDGDGTQLDSTQLGTTQFDTTQLDTTRVNSNQPTPSVVAELMDRIAARSAAFDLVAEERQRVEQLRREHSAVADRLSHLDALETRAAAEAQTSAAEVAALTDEHERRQVLATRRPKLVDDLAALDQLLVVRQKADQAATELLQLTHQRSAIEVAVTAARNAIEAADGEIAALSALANDVQARRTAAADAKRRCQRRAELDRSTAEVARTTEAADAATKAADATFAAFVGQTAPRLAAELIDDDPCPVCGSCEHPAPAGAHGQDDRSVDAAAVERASAAASVAEADQTRWRTTVVNLIEDDPQLSAVEMPELEATNLAATMALAAAEDAELHRDQLVINRSQLQAHLADTVVSAERASNEAARAQLGLRELEGALGDAAGRSQDELDLERHALVGQRVDADEAVERLRWINARRDEIVQNCAEAERLSRQRAVDRATAAERIEQLLATITTSETQLDAVLGGEELSAKRQILQSLRSALSGWQEQTVTLARIEAALASSDAACRTIVQGAGFDEEMDAVKMCLPSSTVEQHEASYGRWSHELAAHRAALAALEIQELPDQRPDLDQLTAAALAAAALHRDVAHVLNTIEYSLQSARADLADVAALDVSHAQQRADYETLQRVASVVRGQNSRRLSLENWVLSVYLHDVVDHANLHLATMSNGRYRLAVQDAPSSQVGQHGLDLVVDDAHTGRVRSSMSLSGGETFQASLALALGLADVVMLGRAGLHLDALFVDEGFGSLDADAIDQAITVLDGLRSRGSMVGVITHVEALKNALPVAIDVQPRSDLRGSEIRQVA